MLPDLHSELRNIHFWRAMNPLLCFVHLAKTAGTSLVYSLEKSLGAQQVLRALTAAPADEYSALDELERQKLAVFWGHARTDQFMPIKRQKVFLTVVRDPVQRVVSYYNFVHQKPNHPLAEVVRSNTLIGCIEKSQTFREENSNAHCFYISTKRDCATAIQEIDRRGWIVSTSDRLDVAFGAIRDLFGWHVLDAGRKNVAPQSDYFKRLFDGPTIALIEELNREDKALYDEIRRRVDTPVG